MSNEKTIINPKDRFKLIPAVYLVLMKDNKIMLSKRQNTGFEDGNYGLISGHLEGDESVTRSMVREAKEEADIEVSIDDIEVAHVLHRGGRGRENERVDFFLTCDKWRGEIKNMEPQVCAGLEWFDLDDLPNNTIGYIREVLENIRKGITYSELYFN